MLTDGKIGDGSNRRQTFEVFKTSKVLLKQSTILTHNQI
jgi:hypothetical protein